MKGNKVSEKTARFGVVVMGEYEISAGSEAARCLIAKITFSVDRIKLQKCWDEPLVMSTFYYFFISWYISNYNTIRDLLKEWLNDYRKVNLGVHDRLQETHYYLNTAYKIFLRYCLEKNFTSTKNAQLQHHSFIQQLTGLVHEQHKRVKKNESNSSVQPDYLELINTMCKGKNFHLADSPEKFKDIKHDGLIYYDCLCIRSMKLMEKINRFVPDAKLKDVVDKLLEQNALKIVKSGDKTVQISGLGGKRFYAIKLGKLK